MLTPSLDFCRRCWVVLALWNKRSHDFNETHKILAAFLPMSLYKVLELIHNSTNHQNLDKASVSVMRSHDMFNRVQFEDTY